MSYLLDVNLLIAAIWQHHPQHAKAVAWLNGKQAVLCPLTELGFLRISTNRNAFGATMAEARTGLENFSKDQPAKFIAADLLALDSTPATSDEVTDHYLADLAAKHGLKLATFDTGIKHKAVAVVS